MNITRQHIVLLMLLAFTIFATWNFTKPIVGISIWDSEPTISEAYSSGFLMSIPMWIGLICIMLVSRKEQSTNKKDTKSQLAEDVL